MDDEDWIDTKVLDKYRTPLKIIGLFALVVAAIIYGQNQYIIGRSDQCMDMDGYLFYEDDYLCMGEPWLSDNGFIVDKEKKQLKRRIMRLESNLSNFNWSSIKINLTELGLDENGSFINETA